jgi:xylan 1,4-beta-xylosidase
MITIESNPPEKFLHMPWRNCIAVGRGYELLRKDLFDHLRILQRDIGYNYCRFHGIFHDDVAVVVRRPDGKIQYQWHQVDKIYDSLLEIGLRPFVELNPMPAAMASGTQTIFWWKMNVTPPRDFGEWEDLVFQFTSHLVDRYGLEEVRQWYFEVWNEPNLPGFWSGTQADYWNLYDTSARAVKRVDSQLRIGGPASSKSSWLTDFITHCDSAGTPVDFVSTHLYPQDEYVQYTDRQGSPHQPGEYFADTIRAGREEVRRSKKPNLPIHWTEWNAMSTDSTKNVDWTDNPTNDLLFGAAFVVKNMLALDKAAETLAWWVASDVFEEGAMPHGPFSGTYGLLTIHGIPKASYNAFRFLAKLRGAIAAVHIDSPPIGCGAFATVNGDVHHAVLWNCALPGGAPSSNWRDTVRLPAGTDSQYIITMRIKSGAGSCYETWLAMGRPQNLSSAQESLLRAHAVPEHRLHVIQPAGGMIELPIELLPGEVLYLELRASGPVAAPKGAKLDDVKRWNKAMSDRSL